MKLVEVLVGLSVAAMVAVIVQAVRQELNLRSVKASVLENSAEIKKKEEAIIEIKAKVNELRGSLNNVNAKMNELKKKREDGEKSTQEFEKTLQGCNTEKEKAAKRKTEIAEALTKVREEHEAAKKTAETDIQNLKQHILDREKAICAFADTTNQEARKLCGIAEAPK